MGALIQYDHEHINACSMRIRRQMSEAEEIMQGIQQVRGHMEATWEGNALAAFQETIFENLKASRSIIEEGQKIQGDLTRVNTQAQDNDRSIAGMF